LEEDASMEDILIDGDKIRALRNKKRWTQKDLAMAAGVDQGLVSRLENNDQRGTRIDTLVAVARALGVATDDLLVPAEPLPMEPTDPQMDVMMRLVEDMTPEERESAEMFVRFVIAQRRRRKTSRSRPK
jgi:transcriptional regulator with XRE-family HTH domain